jgi:uncharacterized protein with FMN-binding domain
MREKKMKRALLIAGGTISGLGAVLAITPPQLGSSQAVGIANGAGSTSGGTANSTTSAAATTASAAPSASSTSQSTTTTTAKKSVVKKSTSKSTTQSATTQNSTSQATAAATPAQTQAATPSAAPTPTAAKSGVSGTFTGPSVFVSYGNVQVEITVRDGKIVDAQALQSPNGRSQRFSDYALPQLRQETLAAQSDKINNISGASYTSYGWYKSLQGALAKAGL